MTSVPPRRRPPALDRRAWLLGLLACVALPAAAGRAVTVEGTTFPGDITLADTPLQLNGVGLRAVAWFKGYAAGLYLPRKATTTAAVLAQPGAKRLQLRMFVDVDAEEFVKSYRKGIDRNTPPAEVQRIAERSQRFESAVLSLGKLKKQDIIDLDSLPGRGLQLSLNSRPRGEPIPGEDLYAALLRCFLGDSPADRNLKVGLLGGPLG